MELIRQVETSRVPGTVLLIWLPLLLAACSTWDKASVKQVVSDHRPLYHYQLKRIFEVDGRQGIATDEDFYYVSGSKALYKYSKHGVLLAKNEKPFVGYKIPANHIGDIDVDNGEIYVGAEYFMDGTARNIQITIHDTDTLELKRTFPFEPASGQLEVSGITVDRANKTVWLASWADGNSGRYLYQYDLNSGKYLRKLHLQPVPQWIQGIFAYEGNLYVTADDGDANDGEYDHLYRVAISDASNATVIQEKTFTEVKRVGEIEGLSMDPKTGNLLVHFNRGKHIIQGMPKGFYPGYTKEIHEVYIYDMKKKPVNE
jgi:hypothetical protein